METIDFKKCLTLAFNLTLIHLSGVLVLLSLQVHPWDTKRPAEETRSRYYLRKEFVQRMEGLDAVSYILQIQISDALDDALWNPQLVGDYYTTTTTTTNTSSL